MATTRILSAPSPEKDAALYNQLPKPLLSDYVKEKNHTIGTADSAQHNIQLLRKTNSLYFFKYPSRYGQETEIDIRSERLIGEFLRMLIPRQPETNLLFEGHTENATPIGIVSTKVDNFKSFGSIGFLALAFLSLSGSITGFGEICTLLMLTCEHDGKVSGNIGINSQRQTIKLDGGETMLSKFDPELSARYPLREKDINNLPMPPAFVKSKPVTWLYPNIENHARALLWLLSFKKNIRHEINLTLLKFMLVPEDFSHYLTKYLLTPLCRPEKMWHQLKQRTSDVKIAALENKSFCTYITSRQSEKDLEDYTRHLDEFTLCNEVKLSELSPGYKETISQKFHSLKQSIPKHRGASYSLSFKLGASTVILLLGALVIFVSNYLYDEELKPSSALKTFTI